jgi:hypothetical protein
LRPAWAKLARLYLEKEKQNTNKRAGVMAQVVEHCLAYLRPWVPSPALQKKKKKKYGHL